MGLMDWLIIIFGIWILLFFIVLVQIRDELRYMNKFARKYEEEHPKQQIY